MSNLKAVYSTASLKALHAQPFQSLQGKLQPALIKAVDVMGFEYMTPVQSKVLSELPTLKSDCLVQAKTGTGKTIAFLLPALQSFLTSPPLQRGHVAILVLSPTRELALQIAKECDQLTSQLQMPIECHTAFGGTARASNHNRFMSGAPSVLVATPGRLKDYLSEAPTKEKFSNLQTLILDEADTMLETGFLNDILQILRLLPPKKLGWQGMCFSATVPPKIRDVINCVLKPGYTTISTIDRSEPPTHARVPQFSVVIPSVKDTFAALLYLIQLEYQETLKDSKIIVFGTTAQCVALYAKVFQGQTPLKVYELQSRLSQSQRTRTTAEFKAASSGLMFATDVVGRGMDFPNVTLVVQVGLPSSGEQYVHRVGRTARADKDGRAVILLTQAESFFLHTNPQLSIEPHKYSAQINNNTAAHQNAIGIMAKIEDIAKQKAYSAYLGFMKGFMNKLRVDPQGLVAMANELALEGMNCPEPPAMERSTVSKMGLKNVPGIRYAARGTDDGPHHRHPPKHPRSDVASGINSGRQEPSRKSDARGGKKQAGKKTRDDPFPRLKA